MTGSTESASLHAGATINGIVFPGAGGRLLGAAKLALAAIRAEYCQFRARTFCEKNFSRFFALFPVQFRELFSRLSIKINNLHIIYLVNNFAKMPQNQPLIRPFSPL